jgi:hypothetical protein
VNDIHAQEYDRTEDDRATALRRVLVTTVEESAPRRSPRAGRARMFAIGATLAIVAVAVVAVPALQALIPPGSSGPAAQPPGISSGSRAKLYSSIAELAADSGAVVAGTVVSQVPGADGTIVSDVKVDSSYRPKGLGNNVASGAVSVPEAALVKVTIFGPTTSAGSAYFTTGQQYLLFLTPTGLPGADQDEFFITGVTAGLYIEEGDHFVKSPSEGDELPITLTADTLQ